MKSLSLLVAVAGLALACGGCKSSDDPAPVSLDQFPQQFANAYCDTIGPCCNSVKLNYDAATCKRAATDSFSQTVALSNGPNTVYDAAAAGRCLSALRAALQSCQELTDETTGAACAAIFQGTLPLGASCKSSAECANAGYCQSMLGLGSQAGGVCTQFVPATHGKLGEACVGDCSPSNDGTSNCSTTPTSNGSMAGSTLCYAADGLYCTSTGACAVLGQIGSPCSRSGACVAGAFCDGTACTAQRDSGSCAQAFDACSAKSYCDQAAQQCFAKKPNGDSCQSGEDCVGGRCSSGICGAANAANVDSCAGKIN